MKKHSLFIEKTNHDIHRGPAFENVCLGKVDTENFEKIPLVSFLYKL